MIERKSFLLYTEYFKQIKKLSIEQRGILLTAIMNFQSGEDLPEMDPLTDMCFGFISDDMQRNNEKYEETVEKRREAGRKGGLTTQANRANATFASFASNDASKQNFKQNQANQANQADKDNVKENVNENESVSVSEYVPASQAEDLTTDTTTLTQNTNTSSEYGEVPTVAQIAFAFGKYKYKPEPTEMDRFVKYNMEHKWKLPLDEAVTRWIANEKKRENKKKDHGFDEHDYDFDEIDRKLMLVNQREAEEYEQRNMDQSVGSTG